MSSLIAEYLRTQQELEREHRDFLDSLLPHKTCTVQEALTDPHAARRVGLEGWFLRSQFLRRLETSLDFMGSKLDSVQPLIFFQKRSIRADQAFYDRQCARSPWFRHRFGSAGPEAFYLHTRTSFVWKLDGSWGRRNRTIKPHSHFASYKWYGIHSSDPGFIERRKVIGYQIPDYAQILGVSPEIATDYFARIVIHDIGHMMRPGAGQKEPLHDSLMVRAMGVAEHELPYRNPWEELVHRECTVPLFFAEAVQSLRSLPARELLSPVQECLRSDLLLHFTETGRKRRELVGIPGKCKNERLVRRMNRIVRTIQAKEFGVQENAVRT